MKSLLAILSLAALLSFAVSQCTYGDVRLDGGAGPWEGNVQICINNTWGWICQNQWGNADARVACKQLGFSDPGGIRRIYAYYGWPNASQPIWLDKVRCTGSETNLLACPRAASAAIGTVTCNHNALAGVVCQNGGPTCSNNALRMIRSQTGTPFNNRGRIEICSNGQWGTICDDGWGLNDAKVACAQLGFSKNNAAAYSSAVFGRGYGSIIMHHVTCTSSESTLAQCGKTLGSSGCNHREDAGIRCAGKITTSCVTGTFKLWRAYGVGPAHDGLALYCKNSQWVPVCDDSWRCDNGRLICQKLGYAGILNTRGEYHYGYYEGTVDRNAYSCSSSHTDLSQCSYYYHSSCNAAHDQIGLVCYSPIIGSECTNGQVRLVNGETSAQGRAEFCYEGFWYPFCEMNSNTALAICQTLGYNSSVATIYSDQRYGDTNKYSSFKWLNCPNGVHNTDNCNVVQKKTGGCRIVVSKCSREYGVGCHNTGTCTNGDMRLIDGLVDSEGRLEVCVGGVWGGVCGANFGRSDAYVACSHLGYSGAKPNVKYASFHGESDGPILLNNVNCLGWESSFDQCGKQVFPSFYRCAPQWSIGLVCKDNCTWGSVRLTGGPFPNEGTVEVCLGQWSYVAADSYWSDTNAQVVCNQLGFTSEGSTAVARSGSYYGKARKPLRLINMTCSGNEKRLVQCGQYKYSYRDGVNVLSQYEVAGVDCIYDAPTDPPCVPRPASYDTPNAGNGACTSNDVRLTGGDAQNGRLEMCIDGYWSPFCKMDPLVASVACRQLGYSDYSWGAIVEDDSFGKLLNYSLFDNLTCTGSESSLSQCTINYNTACTPFCWRSNLGLRCYDSGKCTSGAIRLVDGYIENEGRVEVCVQGVWGAVCDQGFDKTDAHVVCQQLGHPELEPVVFPNSEFGDGLYPIAYTNMNCGGWESSLSQCSKQTYPNTACSRSNLAGVLCGYACNDGDVRLVGSQWNYEGTVQVCFDNLWGQISDSGWTQNDAQVICRQLGYEAEGSLPAYGSKYGKTNFTIHLSQVHCGGDEDNINDCTTYILPLTQGKALLATSNVAGVKCYTPDQCVPPPNVTGSSCTDGQVRLTGGKPDIPEGNVEYCYQGTWSALCNLAPMEATTICRQLGYTDTNLTAVFTDGRFGRVVPGTNMTTSLFQRFSCAINPNGISLSACDIVDSCMSTCNNPIGLRCYTHSDCSDGDVRLTNGTFSTQGRLEVCSNNIWGSVCSTGFDPTDAYVVCNELGLGDSEPTVYNNSYFGDGDGAIIFSNFQCEGYEQSTFSCPKDEYGTFECPRGSVVGITCQDSCSDSDVRLVGSNKTSEGTVEVCYYNNWGIISDDSWGSEEAQVVCRQLGFSNPQNARATTGSAFGKPNAPVQLSGVGCSGREANLSSCPGNQLTPEESQAAYNGTSAAGVVCIPPVTSGAGGGSSVNGTTVAMIFMIILLVAAIIAMAFVFVFFLYKRKQGYLTVDLPKVTEDYSSASRGVVNPIAAPGLFDAVKPARYSFADSTGLTAGEAGIEDDDDDKGFEVAVHDED